MDLIELMKTAMVMNDGKGRDDDVPAYLTDLASGETSEEPTAAISKGEYIVPAWLVSMMGGGNSEAGGRVMDTFMAYLAEVFSGEDEEAKTVLTSRAAESLGKILGDK